MAASSRSSDGDDQLEPQPLFGQQSRRLLGPELLTTTPISRCHHRGSNTFHGPPQYPEKEIHSAVCHECDR